MELLTILEPVKDRKFFYAGKPIKIKVSDGLYWIMFNPKTKYVVQVLKIRDL